MRASLEKGFLTDNPLPRTHYYSMDEPCGMLLEFNGPALDSHSVRRWLHLWVLRNDEWHEYREDMGPPGDYGDVIVLSGGEMDDGINGIAETVGRLIDCANDIKLHPFETEGIVRTDLEGAYHDVMDQRRLVIGGN